MKITTEIGIPGLTDYIRKHNQAEIARLTGMNINTLRSKIMYKRMTMDELTAILTAIAEMDAGNE